MLTLEELVKVASESEVKSINSVVKKLLEIVNDPNSSALDLRREIEIDPPLSAKVLRRANSAYYGLKTAVGSIQNAIVLIGFNAIREMALNLKVGEYFSKGISSPIYTRKNLWEHSLAVALCAKNIYRWEWKLEGNEIYSYALLHDLGMLVEEQFLEKDFKSLLDLLQKNKTSSPTQLEKNMFGYTHSDIDKSLMEAWNFPAEMSKICSLHHDPFILDSSVSRALLTIHISEYLANHYKMGHDCFTSIDEKTFHLALKELKLSQDAMLFIAKETMKTLSKMKESGEL